MIMLGMCFVFAGSIVPVLKMDESGTSAGLLINEDLRDDFPGIVSMIWGVLLPLPPQLYV